MNLEKISVIVPIYKVEKYLQACVESITNQTYENLEIILVDDGSPDNCPKMIDEYAKNDKRIKVIHKENGGLSSARNAGLEIATGEYVIFVDSDDSISVNNCKHLYELAKKYGADIVVARNVNVYENEDGKIIKPKEENEKREAQVVSKAEILKTMMLDGNVGNFAHTKLFKLGLFNDIRFPNGKVYEDVATTYKLIHNAEKIVYTNEIVYYYLVGRIGAITYNFSEKKILDSLEAYNTQYKFLKENYKEINDYINLIWVRMFTSAMEKIRMNDYEELWNRQDVLEKYDDFVIAMDEVKAETLQKHLEPYRLISAILLRYDRETYKNMFPIIFEKIKGVIKK